MSTITTHIDGEKVKVLKGFKINDKEVLISDSDRIGDCEEIRVIIEPSLMKFWIEACDLLKELGIDATVW